MKRVLFHPRSLKFLKKISKSDSTRVLNHISQLENVRKHPNLDIKKLATAKKTYRLRVGTIRVIFEMGENSNIIYIHDIDYRGNIY
ncbi:hypothetical protein A3D77_00515 [Candidatus Gottesmanbacteria bacterium RIFCSPHIGHO2_02_FULL_39_11]|uniref:Plasmid stabilization protein n=1 Tax=Candidatus Gottesmanbacteria bacterium RIFCSPHIGHO2_02_FULL_39_11 TaxID=1798382 RepID=A0A1F5ZL28_9BACT|nr:MAG: hypothetical protein A3D77_00515 [Candidatus Gottesmanbacteria bacterium RIFCSPHIGHO2_02_FULL_39_11]